MYIYIYLDVYIYIQIYTYTYIHLGRDHMQARKWLLECLVGAFVRACMRGYVHMLARRENAILSLSLTNAVYTAVAQELPRAPQSVPRCLKILKCLRTNNVFVFVCVYESLCGCVSVSVWACVCGRTCV